MSRASFVALALAWLTAAVVDTHAVAAPAAVPDFPFLPAGDLPVGYRAIHLRDVSRSFGPRTDLDGQPLPCPLGRPVQFHLWYPARPTGGSTMRFADYVRASVAPTGSAPDDSAAAARALESCRERPLRRGADPARLEAWLERPALARRDAPPAEGRFPLVVYAPSINSDPWENSVLIEHLASRGFVVASAPSVGEDEAAVSADAAGSHAQQDDLRFVLARALDDPSVDPRRVGVIGFSWGGMNGMQLALRHAGVSAVVSLDGAHAMPEYRPIAASFPWWDPRRLRAACLEIVPRGAGRDTSFTRDSLYADTYRCGRPLAGVAPSGAAAGAIRSDPLEDIRGRPAAARLSWPGGAPWPRTRGARRSRWRRRSRWCRSCRCGCRSCCRRCSCSSSARSSTWSSSTTATSCGACRPRTRSWPRCASSTSRRASTSCRART